MDSSELNHNWNNVCEQVKTYNNVDASQVNAFFSRLVPQAMSEGFLILTADNDFIKSWVEQHYLEIIKQALNDLFHVPFNVILAVDAASAAPAVAPSNPQTTTREPQSAPASPATMPPSAAVAPAHEYSPTIVSSFPSGDQSQIAQPQPEQERRSALDDHFESSLVEHSAEEQPPAPTTPHKRAEGPASLTFENFVIGDSNRMAYSMAVDVAETPGKMHLNPLFIYGKSGLGKTHLLRAIQNYINETRPQLKVTYVDSAELLSDYMEASVAHDKEKSSYRNFKQRYEESDVLLIDDVQYFQGKKQTLDIVFQIFNKMTDQGKQVVLSADRAPKNIDIDERYITRFNSGGTFDIQPPEIETKLGIVKSFIEEYRESEGDPSFSISSDIQMYIAENSGSNIRELKGAVNTVIYRMIYCDRSDISIDEVRELLANHFTGGMSRSLTVEDIQREVENFFKVSHSDMVGPKRSQSIVRPRQIAIYLCRQLLDLPYGDIGKKFNRDHSTAIHSATSIEERLKTDRDTQEEIEVLQKIICELD